MNSLTAEEECRTNQSLPTLHSSAKFVLSVIRVTATMAESTFPIYGSEAIVNFFRTEVLTDQEAKHFSKGDLLPVPKVTSVGCCLFTPSEMRHLRLLWDGSFTLNPQQELCGENTRAETND